MEEDALSTAFSNTNEYGTLSPEGSPGGTTGTFLFAAAEEKQPTPAAPARVLNGFSSLELNVAKKPEGGLVFTFIGPAGAFKADWKNRCCASTSEIVFRGSTEGFFTSAVETDKPFAEISWTHVGCCSPGSLAIKKQGKRVANGTLEGTCCTDTITLFKKGILLRGVLEDRLIQLF